MAISTPAFQLSAPAKLNLFLHITGRRPNGYHNLQSVFQFIDVCDTLEFALMPSAPSLCYLTTDRAELDNPDNLIIRAAELLAKQTNQALPKVHIHLTKRLPMGGGLGGGSSDAATTLLGLNQLWQLNLSTAKLAKLALQLGADVPVFVGGQAAFAEGVGEQLTPISPPTPWYLIIHPGVHISTAEIFQHADLPRTSSAIKAADWRFETTRNDCQQLVGRAYPEVAKALQWLLEYAPARLTGTGACVFGVFPSQIEASNVCAKLPVQWTGVVARGLNQSPVCHQLRQASMTDSTTKSEV